MAAVVELQALDVTVARDAGGVATGVHPDAHLLDASPEHVSGGRVELLVHQVRRAVDDAHLRAPAVEPIGGLKAEKAAPDHGGPGWRGLQHPLHVLDGAEDEHALLVPAGQVGDRGGRAGCEHEPVVLYGLAVRALDGLGRRVYLHDAHPEPGVYAALLVPLARAHPELGEPGVARHVFREPDAVIGPGRLLAVDGQADPFPAPSP